MNGSSQPSPPARRTHAAWLGLALAILLAGALLLVVAALPHGVLSPLADRFARDGTLESFTPALHQAVRLPLGLVGGALALLGVYALLDRRRTLRWVQAGLTWLRVEWRAFWDDAAAFGRDLCQSERDPLLLVGVFLLTLLALAARLLLVNQPMRYDEAYTILAFALRPLRYLVADYHLPNNHIFHSVLVHLSYYTFGAQPWAVRLPVLAAGVTLVPVTYLAGKALYGRGAGLLGAALVATSWELIDYSTNARGYMLLALFAMLVLGLAAYLRRSDNRMGWAMFTLFTVLGFYTLPTMLYPYGIVAIWLFCAYLVKDTPAGRRPAFLVHLLASGVTAGLLTLLLYTPVFLTSGVGAVTGNRWVSSLAWGAFTESVPVRVGATWRAWVAELPPGAGTLLEAGMLLGLLFHRRIAAHKVPTQLAALFALAVLLTLQRVAPLSKVWVFLWPLAILWGAAGLVGVFALALSRWGPVAGRGLQIAAVCALLLLAAALSWNPLHTTQAYQARGVTVDRIEAAARYLETSLSPGDAVVADSPVNYPLYYYFLRAGLPGETIYDAGLADRYRRAWIVVSEVDGQTLAEVLRRKAPSFGKLGDLSVERYRQRGIVLYELTW